MQAHNANSTYAQMQWHDNMPYSLQFQDIYFSTDNGLLESEYVFLQGNNLTSRWQSLNAPTLQSTCHTPVRTFTIFETGFGTGLNFLCACKLWLDTAPQNATLHFISVEKFPLSLHDITAALQLWPVLSELSAPLLAQYETLLNIGNIKLGNNSIQLSLMLGDALQVISKQNTSVDAWFLDGFSPAKNPDMWQPSLFEAMANCSHATTTFATFTSAGNVRRELIAAGFNAIKRIGFGKKREMLYGHFNKAQGNV